MYLRTGMRTILSLALVLGVAATAAAEQPDASIAPVVSAKSAKSIFGVPFPAAQDTTTSTPPPNNHQFGAGVRLGGASFGIGGSVRYFFYGGPLGVQAEIARFGYDIGPFDWSSTQFSPAVIYRFVERTFEAPLTLTPYAGGGLNFIHSNFDDAFVPVDEDDTSVGVLLFGGAELFFERVPNLGVSAELSYTSNDDVRSSGFGSTSLGGVAFTAAAHWYFW